MRNLSVSIDDIDVTYYIDTEDLSEVTLSSEQERIWDFWLDSKTVSIHNSCVNKLKDINNIIDLKGLNTFIEYGDNNKILNGKITKVTNNHNKNKYDIEISSNGKILAESYLFKEERDTLKMLQRWSDEQSKPKYLFNTYNTASGDKVKEIIKCMLDELVKTGQSIHDELRNMYYLWIDENTWFNKFSVEVEHEADFLAYENYFLDETTFDHEFKVPSHAPRIPYIWGLRSAIDSEAAYMGLFIPDDDNDEVEQGRLYVALNGKAGVKLYKVNFQNDKIIIESEPSWVRRLDQISTHEGEIWTDIYGDPEAVFARKGIDRDKTPIKHLVLLIKQHLYHHAVEEHDSEYLFEYQKEGPKAPYTWRGDELLYADVVRRYYLQTDDDGKIKFDEDNIESLHKKGDNYILLSFSVDLDWKEGFYHNGTWYKGYLFGGVADEYFDTGSANVWMFAGFTKQQKDRLFYEYEGNVQAKQIMKDMAKITNSYIYIKPDNTITIRDRDNYNADEISINRKKIIDFEQTVRGVQKDFSIPESILATGQFKRSLGIRMYEFFQQYLSGELIDTKITILDYKLDTEIYQNPILDKLIIDNLYGIRDEKASFGTIRSITYNNNNTIQITATRHIQ